MCLLVMDGLNEVMPQTKGVKFTESIPYFAGAKTSRQVVEAGLDRFIPLIRHHKEMVSQMFDIKINVITSKRQTLKSKLNLVNAIFKKTFGLTLKGKQVYTGNHNVFTLLSQAGGLSGVCFCSHHCQINSFIFTLFSMGLHWVRGGHENIVKTHENDELNFHLKEWPRPGPTELSRAFPAEGCHRAACLRQRMTKD